MGNQPKKPEQKAQQKQPPKPESKAMAEMKYQLQAYPGRNCLIAALIAATCLLCGYYLKSPLIMALGLIPAALYESFRAWGPMTRIASLLFVLILITVSALFLLQINFDMSTFKGGHVKRAALRTLALVDIKVVALLIMALLSLVLVIRSAGPYTKLLSLLIMAGCIFMVWQVSPKQFPALVERAWEAIKHFFYHVVH